MTRKMLGFVLVAALVASAGAIAQTGVPEGATGQVPAPAAVVTADNAPAALSELVKLQILNAAKDVENLTLRKQLAEAALQQLIAASTPAGYAINERLELVPIKPEAKTPGK